MALQNNYTAVIDYTWRVTKCTHTNVKVTGKARDCAEAVRLIHEKFARRTDDSVRIKSIRYLGWETF